MTTTPIDPDVIDEWRQLLGEGRCLCSSAHTDWAALDDFLARVAAVTAERDKAVAAVGLVREMAHRWKEAAGQDRDPESKTLRAVSAYLTAALSPAPTSNNEEAGE